MSETPPADATPEVGRPGPAEASTSRFRVPGLRMTPRGTTRHPVAPPRREVAHASAAAAVPKPTPVAPDLGDTAERPRIDAPLAEDRPPRPEPDQPGAPDRVVAPEVDEAPTTRIPPATQLPTAPESAQAPTHVPPAATSAAPAERRRGRGILAAAALLLILAAGYAALGASAQHKLPRGTTVSGVEVGGQSAATAKRTLRGELDELSQAPIPVTVDGAAQSIAPQQAGLSVDYPASIAQAQPISGWGPGSLLRYLSGGEKLDAKVNVEETAFTAVLDQLGAQAAKPPREGGLRFVGTKLKETKPADGRALDVEAAGERVRAAYLNDGKTAVLETGPAAPEIDQADIDQAKSSFGVPAMSAPITLTFSGQPVTLHPAQLAPTLFFEPKDGQLVPRVRPRPMAALLEGKVDESRAPVDATVRIVDGRPQVIKAKPGIGYTPDAIETAVLSSAAGTQTGRTVAVKASKAQADFTTKQARALKIRRKVSSFTTYYPYAAYRNINIPRAASLINGTVLKPGETFSMNGTVGERTAENGFTTGFIISNGMFAEELGGGVSQVATTTYNAAFFAGLQDVEHWPHSFFIDRYPPGREATVAWGAKDLRFKNDTPYGVLIEAHVSPATAASSGVVTVSMWSTKLWDVTSASSNRYNFTEPKTRTIINKDGKCLPNVGYGGFSIDVTRYWHKAGSSAVAKQETKTTTYIPADTVICKEPDEPITTP